MRIPAHPVLLALPALALLMAGAHASTGPDGSVGEGPSAVTLTEEEYPTWNLPDGATVRLGKGRVSRGERAVAFSPDGRSLAVATNIGVWLHGLEDRGRLTLLPGGAHAVAFSPDGARFASASGEIRLWDLETGTVAATLPAAARYLTFSPDGRLLASGREGAGIQLWEVATGGLASTLPGQTSRITSVSFAPGGRFLASGDREGTVRLWDLESATSSIVVDHGYEIRSVSFSPDGTMVASASRQEVNLWEVASGALVYVLEGKALQVFSVSYSRDPAVLASGASYGTVQVWNLARAKVRTYSDQGGFVESLAFSPDGRTLASATEGSVFLRDLTTGEATALTEHMEVIPGLAFSPDGSTLATTAYAWDGSIDLWDVATGRRTATLTGASRDRAFAFSPDGRTLAQGVFRGEVRLLDVATGAVIGRLGPMRTIQSPDHVTDVTSVAFSPDGGTLAAGTDEDVIYLWDLESKTRIRTLLGDVDLISFGPDGFNTIQVTRLLFSPDGRTLASGSSSGQVRLWDLAAGTSTAPSISGHEHGVLALSFSPDGSTLASGSNDRARLWDVAGGANTRMLHSDWAHGVDLSPDGTLFAAGHQGGRIRLWEVATGDPLATLEGHAHIVSRVVFSPDGRVLASSSQDGTILLWDVTSILPHPKALTAVGGEEQEGPLQSQLDNPFVVEVRDRHGDLLEGAEVTFAVTAGGGTRSAAVDTTDAQGRAVTTLTLGREPGTNTVAAAVAGLEPVTFTAGATATPDFDLDGEIGFNDFFLFAQAFGGSDPRFDLNASGTVDFADFYLFAEHFGQPARARLLAMARERIGLPEAPGLQQNAPNPFNSRTVIPWFQLRSGPARLEVFALTGQRVAVLHVGPREAGMHRLRWDGRDDQGRPLASGVYVYRLVTAGAVQTRKLTLLR